MRTGVTPSNSIVTWLLLSGRSQFDFLLEAGFGQAIDDLVSERNRQRHQLFGVVAGVAEHQALVAGADFFALRGIGVDAHGDVGALFVEGDEHGAMVGADAHRRFGVADVVDHFADDLLHIDVGLGRDFAGDHGEAGGDHRFAGHAAHGVLSNESVEHAVGDLIGQLVWVAHADRFASKQMLAGCHVRAPQIGSERGDLRNRHYKYSCSGRGNGCETVILIG